MWFLSSRKNRRSNSAPTRRPRARLCLEMLEDRCVPSAGQLDPTFGSGGIVTNTNFGNDSAVVLQPDGKVVTVAQNSSLVRYTTSGSLDSTFGSGGVATTAFGADAIALQSDGRIVIAGTGGGSFALERFNANGSLDKTFGKGGEVTTPFIKKGVYTGAVGRGVVIQGDGKIVVAGYTNNQEWALARYNANGSLDTTFGSGGKVVSVISPGGNEIRGIAIQPDGKLVVAGNYKLKTRTNFAVGRYKSNGTFDRT